MTACPYVASGFSRTAAGPRFLTIVGGEVADGTGAPLRRANVRIAGNRIVAVGDVKPEPGDAIVDASGLVVAPGFIDIHNHSTNEVMKDPGAASQVAQGITTIVVGADGSSPWPIAGYLADLREHPPALNVAVMAGHATIRRLVMRDDYKRAARDDEIAKMAALVEQAMREGAVGLSSGLEYEVGSYSETKELVEMAKVAGRYGGFYMSHIRDEADKSFEAQREAIAIGEQAHVPVQISHLKLGTAGVWHKAATTVEMIEKARQSGADVSADCYPYDAWHSTITVLVPDKQYDSPSSVARALADVGGAANVTISRMAAHPDYEFKTLDAIARQKEMAPVALFIQIVKEGGASVIVKAMVDDDIRAFYQQPWVMVASDGGIGVRHPRGAGTFPRVLGRYVREQQWLTLPEAIRKMTLAPATRLTIRDRGRLQAGAAADIVLFNPTTVVDRSTFSEPEALPSGIEKVLVNGALVWDGGRSTGERPGETLTAPRSQP